MPLKVSLLLVAIAVSLMGCSDDDDGEEPSATSSAGPESTIQFRPVISDAGIGCEEGETNPPAAEAASVRNATGACLELGPAGLEVSSAEARKSTDTGDQSIAVTVTLEDADAERFAQVTRDNLGKQLAIVVFGRVESAPTVNAVIDSGDILIAGLDEGTADRIVRTFS